MSNGLFQFGFVIAVVLNDFFLPKKKRFEFQIQINFFLMMQKQQQEQQQITFVNDQMFLTRYF